MKNVVKKKEKKKGAVVATTTSRYLNASDMLIHIKANAQNATLRYNARETARVYPRSAAFFFYALDYFSNLHWRVLSSCQSRCTMQFFLFCESIMNRYYYRLPLFMKVYQYQLIANPLFECSIIKNHLLCTIIIKLSFKMIMFGTIILLKQKHINELAGLMHPEHIVNGTMDKGIRL